MATMGQKIRALRLEKNIKSNKLAELVGITDSWMVEIELHDKVPSISTLSAIAKELGVHISYFFTE